MSKKNFWLRVIMILLFLTGLINMLFNQREVGMIFMFLGAIFLIIHLSLKAKEQKKYLNISYIFSEKLDVEEYINEYKKFRANSYLSGFEKSVDELSIILCKTAISHRYPLYEELLAKVEEEKNYSAVEKFFYYQSWFEYYLDEANIGKAEYIHQEMEKLYPRLPVQLQRHISKEIGVNRLTLNVYKQEHIPQTEIILKTLLQQRITKISFIQVMYLLGIISYNQKDYVTANYRFSYVFNNGKSTKWKEGAKAYLDVLHTV